MGSGVPFFALRASLGKQGSEVWVFAFGFATTRWVLGSGLPMAQKTAGQIEKETLNQSTWT